MIATMDIVNNKLKLPSIMRDSYVSINGYEYDKINHAYAFGGTELAINTLNQNFDSFDSVNFTTLSMIIDYIGVIDIDIDSEELQYINGYIDDINKSNRTYAEHIYSASYQHLNGTQAMAYSRIRYTAGGDYKRTEKDREVLLQYLKMYLRYHQLDYLHY